MNKTINFLGIGNQKSGTTWLFKNLKNIPEFDLPGKKEFHYFDRSDSYPSPSTLTEDIFWKRFKETPKTHIKLLLKMIYNFIITGNYKIFYFKSKWILSNYNDFWYVSLFKKFSGYTGEITPSYMYLNKNDIRRIYNCNHNIKLILFLRNPIDRAWSHFRYSKVNRSFDNIDLNEIIKFMDSEHQTKRGDYISAIKNYLDVFDNKQLLICFYDSIIETPKLLFEQIIKHICDDKDINIDHLHLNKKVNVSKKLDCPDEVLAHLKNKYYSQIKELSELYGGYFTKWYEDTYNERSENQNKSLTPTIYIP